MTKMARSNVMSNAPARDGDVRSAVLLIVHALGVAMTRAMVDAGLGEYEANNDIVVLTSLLEHGALRPRQLTAIASLTSGGLANLLDRHERAGLLTRTYGTADGDRRSASVTLTPMGTRTADAILDVSLTALAPCASRLRELIEAIDAATGAPAASIGPHVPRTAPISRLCNLGNELGVSFASTAPADPTPNKSTVTLCLAADDPSLRPVQLADALNLTSGGVSQLLDRLERDGLVRRTRGSDLDMRAVTIAVTDAGRATLERRLVGIGQRLPRLRTAFAELQAVIS